MKEILACELCNGNCMGCWHSDICNAYNDLAPYDRATVIVEDCSSECE